MLEHDARDLSGLVDLGPVTRLHDVERGGPSLRAQVFGHRHVQVWVEGTPR